jgi:DNA repair protein RadC
MCAFGWKMPWRTGRTGGPRGFADAPAGRIRTPGAEGLSRRPVEDFEGIAEETGTRPPRYGGAAREAFGPRSRAPPQFSEQGGPHGHRKRMREKLVSRGVDALADYELLEMLLFHVWKEGDTKPLAKRLINHFGSYAAVLNAPDNELLDFNGVGSFTLATLRLVKGSAIRLAQAELRERPLLNNQDALRDYLTAAMAHESREHFRVLFLDPRNHLIRDEVLGMGTVNHVAVYPREVVKRALELHATALILVHNHPSGNPEPSTDDITMTEDLRMVGQTMSIVVHDHIIVGRGGMVSLKARGWI